MPPSLISRVVSRLRRLVDRYHSRYLASVSGVIHVGANAGQERYLYQRHRLRVAWIEPIPHIHAQLVANLAGFPDQRAYRHLVADRDDIELPFHLSNNSGSSSSYLDLAQHRDLWPEVAYEQTILLRSITLPSLLQRENLAPADYQALVLDTQGSELAVLRGAESLLGGFRFIKTEAADFEAYRGGCQVRDLDDFLLPRGFARWRSVRFAGRPGVGNYYDLYYRRVSAPSRATASART